MNFRPVFTLTAEAEVRVVSLDPFRVRITGDPDQPNSPDFEIEGNPEHISNAVAVISALAVSLTGDIKPGTC